MWKRIRSGLFGGKREEHAANSSAPPTTAFTLAPPPSVPPRAAPVTDMPAPPATSPLPVQPAPRAQVASSPLPVDDLDDVLAAQRDASAMPALPTAVQDDKDADDDMDDEVEGNDFDADTDEAADDDDDDFDADESDESDEVAETSARAEAILTRDRAYFGEETWGVSQRHRDAVMDAARLARYDLPPLADEAALASWLGIPLKRLRWYTRDRPADRTWHYVRYIIPKRGGGERVILAPKRELKALQRRVLAGILARVPVAPSVHGFVPGRSIVTNAAAHTGRQVVLKLDLKDFFPSVTYPRVRGLFIALGYSFAVASALALLCTEYVRQEFDREGMGDGRMSMRPYYISVGPRHLVQGAPTSPALANLVAWRLDRRLGGLAAKHGFTYTRYADDLVFSGDDVDVATRLSAQAARFIHDEQFTVNAAKTHLARRAGRQTVTGLVVNSAVATPRERRRRLRAILHNAARTGLEPQNREARPHFASHLMGQIAYVHAANPRQAAPLRLRLRRLVASASADGDSTS